MSRQLKDITITLQWLLPRVPGAERQVTPRTPVEQRAIESSVFAASSAYNADELANLLRSSGSSLSLALDTSNDDTASVLWQPETERSLEPRASFSRASIGPPPQDQLGRLRHTDSSLSSIATSGILQVRNTRRSWLQKNLAVASDPPGVTSSVIAMIQLASTVSRTMYLKDSMTFNMQRSKFSSYVSRLSNASSQLTHELEDIMTRVSSLSALLQVMNEADEETSGLSLAWKSTEQSVREYFDLINRALDRTKKGAGIKFSCLPRIPQRSLPY